MNGSAVQIRFAKFRRALRMPGVPPNVRRAIIGVTGTTLLLVGVAMIVLPGPAFIVIPAGLALLATEFAWARRAFRKARELGSRLRKKKKEPSD